MKKYFLSIVALAGMLFATSCQESLVEPQVGGPTTFTIEIPGQMGTKALNETYNLYVEVYKDNGTDRLQRIGFDEDLTITSGQSKTFSLDLVATQEYDIVFWAQKAGAYGVDNKLTNVDMDIENHHNSEDGAAYYAILNNFKPSEDNPSVSLKRPFAQLNIGTLLNVSYSTTPMKINSAEIKVSQVASEFNRVDFNGTMGVGQEPPVDYIGSGLPYSRTVEVLEVGGNDYSYVSMDYLPVIDNKGVVDVTVKLNVEDPYGVSSEITRTIKSVPLQMNYKTNIVGNLITSATDFTITIDESWNTPNNDKEVVFREVATEAELIEAIEEEVENITLTADITLTGTLTFGEKPGTGTNSIARTSTNETSFVLDLGGKTITTPVKEAGRHHYAIDNYANLTIVGEGAINARGIQNFGTMTIDGNITITNVDTNGGAAIWNEGNITINGGTFTTNDQAGAGSYGAALNTRPGGKAIVNEGTFIANSQLTYAIINEGETIINNAIVEGRHGAVAGTESSVTKIYGGSFEQTGVQGQSDHCVYYVTEISGGSFAVEQPTDAGGRVFYESRIAEGYVAKQTADGSYIVLPEEEANAYDIVITAPAQLTKEVIKEYSNIYLAVAGEYFVDLYDIDYKETLTITGTEGVKFAHTADNYGQLRIEEIQNFTIRNCEILKRRVGNKNWGMMVFSTGRDGGIYTIENCTFNGVETQGIYINQTKNDAVYHIKDCTFNGDFGKEGAITISTNKGVKHTVNVTGCEFNDVPADHRIYLTEGNGGLSYDFTLNTDLKATTADELEMFLNLSNQVNVAKGNYDKFPTTSIKAGQTIICEEGTVFTGNSKLNIKGAKVINATFSNPGGTAVDQTINGVFENCTFTGSNALRWCYAGETVKFINCVFDGSVYGVHFDGGANDVIFDNCVLSGFNAFAGEITSLTFKDCIFKSNGRSGYNGANLWCGATMTNCEFTFDGSAGTEWIDCINAGGTYNFDNCTIGGNNYTYSNYSDYEQIFSSNNATVTINGVACEL